MKDSSLSISFTLFHMKSAMKDLLPGMVRPMFYFIGLLFKRPILGDNPKAHAENCMKSGGFHWKVVVFTEKWQFSLKSGFHWKVAVFMKSGGFHEKRWFSLGNLINQLIQHKSFSFMVYWGKAMYQNSMKTAAFHWKLPLFMKTATFHMKSGSFHEKQWFSLGNLINQLIQHKSFSFMVCWGKAMYQNSMKTAAFHENCTKDHQLPEMVTPMFIYFTT